MIHARHLRLLMDPPRRELRLLSQPVDGVRVTCHIRVPDPTGKTLPCPCASYLGNKESRLDIDDIAVMCRPRHYPGQIRVVDAFTMWS